jgi:hypothetical protein
MAHAMKAVAAPKRDEARLVIEVDPLAVARGHRVLPRSTVHGTAKRPCRARSKHQLRRQLDRERRGAPRRPGPLV